MNIITFYYLKNSDNELKMICRSSTDLLIFDFELQKSNFVSKHINISGTSMGEKLKRWLKQTKFESLDHEVSLNILITAYFLRSKHEEVMNKYGLTMPQYNVLRILNGVYPEGHPRCDIISRMIEPAPDVTRIIDRLMKEKLVERFHTDNDKRLSMTRITEKGIKLLEKAHPEVQALGNYIATTLSNQEKKILSDLLEKVYGEQVN